MLPAPTLLSLACQFLAPRPEEPFPRCCCHPTLLGSQFRRKIEIKKEWAVPSSQLGNRAIPTQDTYNTEPQVTPGLEHLATLGLRPYFDLHDLVLD
jgi:hypothetical protein